ASPSASGCGSAAAQIPLRRFPRSPAGCISGPIGAFARRREPLKRLPLGDTRLGFESRLLSAFLLTETEELIIDSSAVITFAALQPSGVSIDENGFPASNSDSGTGPLLVERGWQVRRSEMVAAEGAEDQ